jgi:hypothetical protein
VRGEVEDNELLALDDLLGGLADDLVALLHEELLAEECVGPGHF